MRPALVIAFALTAASPAPAADPPDRATASREAVALLRRVCSECHGPAKQRGSLRLDTRAAALTGGENGPAVVPGLHLLGLDHEKLTFKYQGREFRLTDVHGTVEKALLR